MFSGSVACVAFIKTAILYSYTILYYPIFIYVALLKMFSGSVACVALIKTVILFSYIRKCSLCSLFSFWECRPFGGMLSYPRNVHRCSQWEAQHGDIYG